MDANSADVVIDWAWGSATIVEGFDPATGTIFISWIGADALEVYDAPEGVIFALPSNNQTTVLEDVTLSQLSASNFTILDDGAAVEVLSLVGPGGGDGDGDGDGGDGDGNGDETPTDPPPPMNDMVLISLTTSSSTIADFDPATDMIHIEAGVTGDRFDIFEESGDALGLTVRLVVTDPQGSVLSVTILQDVGLADLTMANFSVAEQSTLNEVASAIGQVISGPGTNEGYPVVYDTDGSAPPTVTGETAEGGAKYRADVNADDITGFDPARDQLDFGGTSVHGMIVTKTPAGEVAIDSPWSDAVQIVQGVGFQDLSIASFGVVGNEHLRQDIGGVVSWELGVGPREADTVYVRSHEYGVHEVVDDFDPATMKISFLYFGTRERLSVEDTEDGLVISSLPTGQSLTLTGIELADLSPGQVEFHHDQVMEDNLEVPFGFAQDDVTLVERTQLLTPDAPPGETTDGYQTRDGVFDPAPGDNGDTGDGDGDAGDADTGDASDGVELGDGADVVTLGWAWGEIESFVGFDPAEDVINFGNVSGNQVDITEVDDDLVIEILGNGGHAYVFEDVQAEDLSPANLDAPSWSSALAPNEAVYEQLIELGFTDAIA